MTAKRFIKNDSGFTCINCGVSVPPLKTTSRDHCSNCLYSLHVDVNPGDRANSCKGTLEPISIIPDSKKGYIIEFKCKQCKATVRNKAASDDNFKEMLKICKEQQ